MGKIKRTITVMDMRTDLYHKDDQDFQVTKLVNTTEYKIDQFLTKREVDRAIHAGAQVTVIPYKK